MNNILLCPFCEHNYIINVNARYLEPWEGSVVTSSQTTMELVVECPCGATFAGEVVVK